MDPHFCQYCGESVPKFKRPTAADWPIRMSVIEWLRSHKTIHPEEFPGSCGYTEYPPIRFNRENGDSL